ICNFSLKWGLAKNSRVIITSIGQRLVAVKTLQSENDPCSAEEILIPCITFNTTLSSGHTLLCHQFPLTPAYATTCNSYQGLMLNSVVSDFT
ncbi:hypothetical protein BKA83DRAFT_4006697, partial [Pisolithus microcarpus]